MYVYIKKKIFTFLNIYNIYDSPLPLDPYIDMSKLVILAMLMALYKRSKRFTNIVCMLRGIMGDEIRSTVVC